MKEITLRSSQNETWRAAITDRPAKLGKGKEGTVDCVAVVAEHSKGLEIGHLAEKTFYDSKDSQRDFASDAKLKQKIDRLMELHKQLQEKGYPAVPRMLVNEEDNRVYMTDLSLGGEREVISASDIEGDKKENPWTIKNAVALSLQIESLFHQSVNDRLGIYKKDVFFFIYDESTQTGEIVFGDLSKLIFEQSGGPDLDKDILATNKNTFRKLTKAINAGLTPDCQLNPDLENFPV